MAAQQAPIVVVDLGATRFRVALFDSREQVTGKVSEATRPEEGPERVTARIAEVARRLLHGAGAGTPAAIGMAVPGPVDSKTGVIYDPPNLIGWHDVPIGRLMEDEMRARAFVENDANLAGLGEHRYGAGRGVDDMVYLTISTGIGGGIIAGGRLLVGGSGLAGEVGHMSIDRNGPVCRCGNIGCIEALASGPSIARNAVDQVRAGAPSKLSAMVGGDLEQVAAEHVFQAAKAGDQVSRQVIKQAARDIGLAIVSLAHIFNPKLFVVGGGVANEWAMLQPDVDITVRAHAMHRFRSGMEIVTAALGDNAGLMGAAALAADRLGDTGDRP